jgi:3D (Asp-Asp-Asp) domain-containing protein
MSITFIGTSGIAFPDGNTITGNILNIVYKPFLSYGSAATVNNGVKFSGTDGLIIQNTKHPVGYSMNLTINSNTNNYNVRSAAISAGVNPTSPVFIYLTIASGVYVGSTSTGSYALDTGVFPTGSSIYISNSGYIYGAGGDGGASDTAGSPGGPAMRARTPTTVYNSGVAVIGGGGGGGNGGSSVITGDVSSGFITYYGGTGGGGQGQVGGSPNGTAFAPGGGSASQGNGSTDGSTGGTLGSSSAITGAGGAALVGKSFVNGGTGLQGTIYVGQS